MQNDEMQKKKDEKTKLCEITLSSFLTGKNCGLRMGKHRRRHPSLPSKQIKSRMQEARKQNLIDPLQEYHKGSLCVYWFTEHF